MAAHHAFDVRSETVAPVTQGIQVFADTPHLVLVGRPVITPDGHPCGRDELLSQPSAHYAGAVVTPQGGQVADAGLVEGGSGRVRVEDCGRALAVERAHVADELGESEMDQAVELP